MADELQTGRPRRPNGMFTSRVDEKGRLKLPEQLRRYLVEIGSQQVFITSFDGKTARIYPLAVWTDAEALLEQPGPKANEGQQLLFQAQRYGGDAEIDNQGRLLMPAALRRKMAVEEKPVYVTCFRGHLEVLSEAAFEASASQADEDNSSKVGSFVELGLP